MPITKTLVEVIAEGVSVEYALASTPGTYLALGYTKDKSKITAEPIVHTIERGLEKQTGLKWMYKADIVQFTDGVLSTLESLRDQVINLKLTGKTNNYVFLGFSISVGIDTSFSNEELLSFPIECKRHSTTIDEVIAITANP